MELEVFYKWTAIVLTALLGLSVGSFLNVVIYRLPNKMSLSFPSSHCPKCGYVLKWYDNIPVFSYLFLGGKCRSCKDRISPRYIIVEILNCVLWLLCLFSFGFSDTRAIIMTVCTCISCSVLICVALIDLEHLIIFDRFQIILLVLGISFVIADSKYLIISNIITAFAAFGIFYLIGYLVGKKVGTQALGGGDIKFAFVSGLFLGYKRFILMMLISSVVSLLAIAVLKEKNNGETEKNKAYPFGPFLALGFIISLIFGNYIINSYLSLLGIGGLINATV